MVAIELNAVAMGTKTGSGVGAPGGQLQRSCLFGSKVVRTDSASSTLGAADPANTVGGGGALISRCPPPPLPIPTLAHSGQPSPAATRRSYTCTCMPCSKHSVLATVLKRQQRRKTHLHGAGSSSSTVSRA